MKQPKTFSQYLADFIFSKKALTLKNQGTKKPNRNWHQIDLRGNGLLIKHCQNDLEAHLAYFIRNALENNDCVNKDDTGQITSYPGLYIRYLKHYLDLRLEVGTTSYGSKVGDIMQLVAQSFEFNLPLLGQLVDPDGATYYRFDYHQVKPTNMTIEQLAKVPDSELALGDLTIDLNHCEPILLSGVSGTGKTSALELLVAQMVLKLRHTDKYTPMLYIADPKFSDLKTYVDLISFKEWTQTAQTPAEIAFMLQDVVSNMNERYRAMQALPNAIGKTALDLGFAPQFLIIDEYSSLLASLGNSKPDKALKAQIEQSMTQLVQKARQASILVIISLQRASVDSGLTSNIRANCDLKILLGNSDATTTAMLFGSQADNSLPQINEIGGGYFLRANMQQPEKFYVPHFNLEQVVKAYQPTPRERIMTAGKLVDELLEEQDFNSSKLMQIKNELIKLTHLVKNNLVLTAINEALTATNQALKIEHYNEDIMLQIQYNLDRAGDRIVYDM